MNDSATFKPKFVGGQLRRAGKGDWAGRKAISLPPKKTKIMLSETRKISDNFPFVKNFSSRMQNLRRKISHFGKI